MCRQAIAYRCFPNEASQKNYHNFCAIRTIVQFYHYYLLSFGSIRYVRVLFSNRKFFGEESLLSAFIIINEHNSYRCRGAAKISSTFTSSIGWCLLKCLPVICLRVRACVCVHTCKCVYGVNGAARHWNRTNDIWDRDMRSVLFKSYVHTKSKMNHRNVRIGSRGKHSFFCCSTGQYSLCIFSYRNRIAMFMVYLISV